MKFSDVLAKEECKVIIGYYPSELNAVRDYELCKRWLLSGRSLKDYTYLESIYTTGAIKELYNLVGI